MGDALSHTDNLLVSNNFELFLQCLVKITTCCYMRLHITCIGVNLRIQWSGKS